jgi:hypothetical protein
VVLAGLARPVLDRLLWRLARRLDVPQLVTWYYRHRMEDARP